MLACARKGLLGAARVLFEKRSPALAVGDMTLTAGGTTTDPTMTLGWTNLKYANIVRIYRRLGGSPTAKHYFIAAVPASDLSYVDTTIGNGATNGYYIRGCNAGRMGLESAVKSLSSIAGNRPTPATALAVTSDPTGPKIGWSDTSGVETGFVVERSTDGGATWPVSFTVGPRTGTGGVTYIDVSAVSGTTYTYRVKTEKSGVFSAYARTDNYEVVIQQVSINF